MCFGKDKLALIVCKLVVYEVSEQGASGSAVFTVLY
jgi:hypothetical protein